LTSDSGRTFTVADVSTYTIGEVAERSGFSASALRYHEASGSLFPLPPAARGIRLEVATPPGAEDMAVSLFGQRDASVGYERAV
jgi:hypothetical protein